MTTAPRISVCMATYNGARFVAEQLESILMQLGPDDELVVSDDGSTDATLAIVARHADARIRVLRNPGRASPVANFENALRHARHDVLVLTDQDDIWLENKLPIVRERFARPPCSAFCVVLDAVVVDTQRNTLHPSLLGWLDAKPGLLNNLYRNRFVGCCMAFTRETLELALPFPNGVPMHDMWIGMLATAFGRVEFVRDKTLMYRRHERNMTQLRIEFRPVRQLRDRATLATLLGARAWERKAALKRGG